MSQLPRGPPLMHLLDDLHSRCRLWRLNLDGGGHIHSPQVDEEVRAARRLLDQITVQLANLTAGLSPSIPLHLSFIAMLHACVGISLCVCQVIGNQQAQHNMISTDLFSFHFHAPPHKPYVGRLCCARYRVSMVRRAQQRKTE